MDPSGVLQFVAWLVAGWMVAALGLTVAMVAFFRGAHHKERRLPTTPPGLRDWIRPRQRGGRSRAA